MAQEEGKIDRSGQYSLKFTKHSTFSITFSITISGEILTVFPSSLLDKSVNSYNLMCFSGRCLKRNTKKSRKQVTSNSSS